MVGLQKIQLENLKGCNEGLSALQDQKVNNKFGLDIPPNLKSYSFRQCLKLIPTLLFWYQHRHWLMIQVVSTEYPRLNFERFRANCKQNQLYTYLRLIFKLMKKYFFIFVLCQSYFNREKAQLFIYHKCFENIFLENYFFWH